MTSCQDIKKNNLEFLQRIFDEGHRSVELYNALIDNLTKEKSEDIINDLAKSIVGTQEEAALGGLLLIIDHYMHKYLCEDCDEIHRTLYELYWSSDVCKNNTNLRMVLAHTTKDISYLYENIDNQQRVQLDCCINLQKKQYLKAISDMIDLVKVGNYPKLMSYVSLNVEINPDTSEKMCNLIDIIISNGNQQKYYSPINIYIKRLFDSKNLDIGHGMCEKFDEDFIAPFTKADLYVAQDDDEKLYRFLTEDLLSNLNNVVNFFPTCHWLFKSAVRLGKTKELEEILVKSGDTKDCILELIDSIREYNNEQSRRSYRHESEIKCKEKLDVIFCINGSYFKGFQTAITSLVINNGSIVNNMRFHIGIDNTVNLDNLTGFMEVLDIDYKIYNLEKEYKTDDLKVEYGIKVHDVLDKSAYYRIFMFDKLSKDVDVTRILYLDSDVLVLSNLYELLNMKMTSPLYACVEDQEQKAVIKSKDVNNIESYFNSGVLLINTKFEHVPEIIKRCLENVEKQKNLIMHDQCALNMAFNKIFANLDSKFNFLIHQYDMNIVKADICILHLSGRVKPWHDGYHEDEYISNLWFTYYNMVKIWQKIK